VAYIRQSASRSWNVSGGDDYFCSHPERMEVTVVLVDSGSGELDEESITAVQFSRIKLGRSGRDRCSGGSVGRVVKVLPLDEVTRLDGHVRQLKVQQAANRDSKRDVHAGGGRAWTDDGLRLCRKYQHVEHGAAEGKSYQEESREDSSVRLIRGGGQSSHLVSYRPQGKHYSQYCEEERGSGDTDDSTGLILEAQEYHGHGEDLARSECCDGYVSVDRG